MVISCISLATTAIAAVDCKLESHWVLEIFCYQRCNYKIQGYMYFGCMYTSDSINVNLIPLTSYGVWHDVSDLYTNAMELKNLSF